MDPNEIIQAANHTSSFIGWFAVLTAGGMITLLGALLRHARNELEAVRADKDKWVAKYEEQIRFSQELHLSSLTEAKQEVRESRKLRERVEVTLKEVDQIMRRANP